MISIILLFIIISVIFKITTSVIIDHDDDILVPLSNNNNSSYNERRKLGHREIRTIDGVRYMVHKKVISTSITNYHYYLQLLVKRAT